MSLRNHIANQLQRAAGLRLALIPVLFAMGVALMGQLGLFQLPNGLLFDWVASAMPASKSRVIVVRASLLEQREVADALLARGARPILLSLTPPPPRPARGIIVAVKPARILGSANWTLPEATSSGAVATFIPAPQQGVTRRLKLWLPGQGGRLPTLEGAIAGFPSDGPDRFIGLPPRTIMASLTARQVLEGSLPPDMLRGLRVVIGPPAAEDPPRFWVSAMDGSVALSASDFHARAIQSLLSGRALGAIDGLPGLFLLLAFSILFTLFIARLRSGRSNLILTGAVAVILSLYMLLAMFGSLLLPASELLVLTAAIGVVSSCRAEAKRRRELARLGDRAASYVSRNLLLQDQRRWVDFFPAASRLTGVEDSLLLEQQEDGSFSSLAASGLCATSVTPGLRRSPDFDLADASRPTPILLTTIPGWVGGQIARVSGGDDDGLYWLFSAPANSDEIESVLSAAARLAKRIHQYPASKARSPSLRHRAADDARLISLVDAVVSRAGDLRRSLRALHTAAMLFDAAGLPVQINSTMEGLLRGCGLQPARVTPCDVAATLSGLEPDSMRFLLGDLVRNGGNIQLTSQGKIGGRHFTVRVTEADGDLIFEAIDVTDLHRLAHIQTELAGEIDAKIRNDLEAIELASRLAMDERLPQERRERAMGMIAKAAARTRGTLDAMAHLVDASIYQSQPDAYPMSPRSAVLRALADLRGVADQEGIQIEVSQPSLTSLVVAEPHLLDSVVHAMLDIVVRDSPRGTLVTAVFEEHSDFSELVIRGGFGMSGESFAAQMSGDFPGTPPSLRTICRAQQAVVTWGGSLNATSEAGEGFRFDLRLRRS